MLQELIFEKINGLANHWKILDWIGVFCAEYLYYILAIIFLIFLILKRDSIKNRIMPLASVFFSMVLSRLIIAEPIKLFYHAARPYLVLKNVTKLISEDHDYQSFPSGHATVIFAMAMAIYFYNKKLGIFAFILSTLMAIGRIFVGVHWPVDILGGAVIGIISGIIVSKIIKKHCHKTLKDAEV